VERASIYLESFNSYEQFVLYFQNAENLLRTDVSEWGEATSADLFSLFLPDCKFSATCQWMWVDVVRMGKRRLTLEGPLQCRGDLYLYRWRSYYADDSILG
jgi:hypothetical protein